MIRHLYASLAIVALAFASFAVVTVPASADHISPESVMEWAPDIEVVFDTIETSDEAVILNETHLACGSPATDGRCITSLTGSAFAYRVAMGTPAPIPIGGGW